MRTKGNSLQIETILERVKPLAVAAGQAIMEVYQDEALFRKVEYKADKSPLTLADKRANAIITAGLREAFPDYAVLSEEEPDSEERLERELCFIVDPLDGTKEFLKRNGQFTVNIALACRHKSVLGVIYVPAAGDLYYAAKGIGSFWKTAAGDVRQLHVSSIVGQDRVRLAMSSSHNCKEMDALIKRYRFQHFIKMGSSLKGCLIARGDAEVYCRYNPTMEWDTAAMQCIVEEAGAVFRQMDDTEMLYNRRNPRNQKGFYIVNTPENKIWRAGETG